MSDPLLSELCTICHITPPKYTCPRCAIRTCSLACARRHKTWSQCSGVRDPAAYATRAELSTASALDRDFNFITGVERGLERAEREARARGFVDLEHGYMQQDHLKNKKKKRKRGDGDSKEGEEEGSKKLVKGELAFLRAAQEAGVKVERAPRGMTRNKENKSRFHPKHKCLSWTVDWVHHEAGRPRVAQNYLETVTIGQAYDRAYPPALPDEDTTTTAVKQENKTGAFPAHRNIYYIYIRRQASHPVVLAPLHPESKLADVLRGRTVYEYPRLYVMSKSPADIERGDVDDTLLEETWLRDNPTGIEVQDYDEEDWTSSEGSSEESEDDDETDSESDSDNESESEVSLSDVKEDNTAE